VITPMKVRLALVAWCLGVASSIVGQTLTVGPNPSTANSSGGGSGVSTYVDLTVPANANGTATSATFRWAATPCLGDVEIKFFHRSGNTLTMYAQRGPFGVSPTLNTTVALTPPVSVQAGDLIGIAQLTGCGNATALAGTGPSPGYLLFSGDVTGSVTTTSGTAFPNTLLAVGGSGVAVSGPTIPALSPWALALLALVFAMTGYFVLRR